MRDDQDTYGDRWEPAELVTHHYGEHVPEARRDALYCALTFGDPSKCVRRQLFEPRVRSRRLKRTWFRGKSQSDLVIGRRILGLDGVELTQEQLSCVKDVGELVRLSRVARELVAELVSTGLRDSPQGRPYKKALQVLRERLDFLSRRLKICSPES